MASKIEICNLALSRIGSSRITSFSDNTTEAKTLAAIYDQVAENVMSLGPWTSVLKRATLAALVAGPEYEYSYQFQLPTNPKCLKVLEINESQMGDTDYRIEGDKLLTDESSIQILYVGFITDTEAYDAYLRQAITERLICELSYSRTGEYKLSDSMEKAFMLKVEQWLNQNNSQGSTRSWPSGTFTDIRNEN